MKKYSVVLLDLDGTVFDFPKAEELAFQDIQRIYRIKGEYYPRYHEVNARMWVLLEQGAITREELQTRRFEETFLGVQLDFEEVNQRYMEALGMHGILYDGAEELCRYLAGKYRVAAVTNGNTVAQQGRMSRSSIKQYIEVMAVSQEVGSSKPEPEVFACALERLGHPEKSPVILIGDGYVPDNLGGVRFGVDTVWYNPEGKPTGEVLPTYTVGSYDEIYQLL